MPNKQVKHQLLPKNGCFYTLNDCILPPNDTRIVAKSIVTYRGRNYYAPALQAFEAQEVMVFEFDKISIGICMGSELICTAIAVYARQSFKETEQLGDVL